MATKTKSTAAYDSPESTVQGPESKTRDPESEFQYLPLSLIVIEQQIRSTIDTLSESFAALKESIRVKGMLEPLVVTVRTDGKYLLICGERRYLAAQELGLETVPCRVLDPITDKAEIIALQLTENMQREDLNPFDLANTIVAFFRAKYPQDQYDLGSVFGLLTSYSRRPEDVSDEVACTVHAICQITGKSVTTLLRTLSLLKLSVKVQMAILEEKLPVSQGYIFAANLSNPEYDKVLAWALRQPRTNAEVEEKFGAAANPEAPRPSSRFTFKKGCAGLVSWRKYAAANPSTYTKDEKQRLVDQLEEFRDLLCEQMAEEG